MISYTMCFVRLVGWSLTSLVSTNMAIAETMYVLFTADNLSQGSGSDPPASRPYALKGWYHR